MSPLKSPWRWTPAAVVLALFAVEAVGEKDSQDQTLDREVAKASAPVKRVIERSLAELGVVRKWQRPVRIRLQGRFNKSDREHLGELLTSWRQSAPGLDLALARAETDATVTIYSLSRGEFSGYDSRPVPASGALTRVWSEGARIQRARILIDADLSEHRRRDLVFRELAVALGLDTAGASNDSLSAALGIWYRPEIVAGARWKGASR